MVQTYIKGADPNWSYERNDRITNALNTLLAMKERRAKEREREFLLAMKALESNPEMALTPMADDLMARFGDQPGAGPMIQAIKGRALDMQTRMDRVKEYRQNKHDEELEDAVYRENAINAIQKDPAWMRDASGMERPDMVGPPSQQDFSADRFQNWLNFAQEAKARPSAGYRAYSGLTPEGQQMVAEELKRLGEKLPEPPDPFSGFSPPKDIEAMAMAMGPEEALRAWQVQMGRLPSAGGQLQADTTRQGWEEADARMEREYVLRGELDAQRTAGDISVKTTPPGKVDGEAEAKGSAGVRAVAADMIRADKNKKGDKTPKQAPTAPATERAAVDSDKIGWDAGTAADVFAQIWAKALEDAKGDRMKATPFFLSRWARAVADQTPK